MRFPSLTRLMPAYRRKPGARLPPPKLRDQPSRAARIFRRKKQTPFRVSRREHAVAFDGLPRSSFPLATPFSPKGNGCSSSCNPKPKATGGRHEQQKPGTIFARSDAAVYRQRALVSRHALNRKVVFTDGAKHVADQRRRLLALGRNRPRPASRQSRCRRRISGVEAQGRCCRVTPASLTCEDGNGNKVFEKALEFTDFPLPEITLWFADNTIFLPSEY